MAIALCHTVPRDRLVRIVYLLGLVSFTLLLAGLAASGSSSPDFTVWATVHFPDNIDVAPVNRSKIFAVVRGWEVRQLVVPSTSHAAAALPGSWCPVDASSIFASRDLASLPFVKANAEALCQRWLPMGRAATSFYCIACILIFLFWLAFSCCGLQQRIEKNSALYAVVLLLITIPTACCIVATAVFEQSLGHVVDMTKDAWMAYAYQSVGAANIAAASFAGAPMFFVRPSSTYVLFIIATALLCLMWLCTLVRLIIFRAENQKMKDTVQAEAQKRAPNTGAQRSSSPQTAEDSNQFSSLPQQPSASNLSFEDHSGQTTCHRYLVDERLDNRVVNDDWQRQQLIWIQRRLAVSQASKKLEEQGAASSMRGRNSASPQRASETAGAVAHVRLDGELEASRGQQALQPERPPADAVPQSPTQTAQQPAQSPPPDGVGERGQTTPPQSAPSQTAPVFTPAQ